MELTLMTYNIERGFHSYNHTLEKSRLEAAKHAVESANPDILAITEACYGGPNSKNIHMDYQKIFGFPFGQFGSFPYFGPRNGDEGGNCLLSKLPMTAQSVKLAYKGAVRAQIIIGKKQLMLDLVHPSYSVSDDEKISTLKPLLNTRNEPYIITGDFNTVHPEDKYDWNVVKRELGSFNKDKAEWIVNNWKDAKLVKYLLALGLEDAFPRHTRASTVPTIYANKEIRRGVRMDFIFKTKDIETLDSRVIKNEYTEVASDHYPIFARLKIK